MGDTKAIELTTLEKRALKAFHAEQRRRELKQRANLMYAQGHSTHEIAKKLGVSEGAVRKYISVNGGF